MMFDIEADIIRLMEQFTDPEKLSPDKFRNSIDSIYSSYPNNGCEVSQFLLKELCINYFQFMKKHQPANNLTIAAQSTSSLNDTENRLKFQSSTGCQSFSTVDSHDSQNCANDVDFLPSSMKVRYVSQKPSLLGKIPLPTRQEISISDDEVPLSSRSSSICVDSASDVPSQSSRDSESSSNDCEAEDHTAEEGWREALGDRIEGDHTHFDLFRALISSMKENKPKKSSISKKTVKANKNTTITKKKKKNTSTINNQWSLHTMASPANDTLFEEDENEDDESETHGLTGNTSMRMPLTTEMLQTNKHSGHTKCTTSSPSPQRVDTKTKIRSHGSSIDFQGNSLDGNTLKISSNTTKIKKDKNKTSYNNKTMNEDIPVSLTSSHWNTENTPTTSTISHRQPAIVVAAKNSNNNDITTTTHHTTTTTSTLNHTNRTPSSPSNSDNNNKRGTTTTTSVHENTTTAAATIDDTLSSSPSSTLRGKIAYIICEEMARHQSSLPDQNLYGISSNNSSSSSNSSHHPDSSSSITVPVFSELLLHQIGSSLLTVLLSEATLHTATASSVSPFSPLLLLPRGGLLVGGVGDGVDSEGRDLAISLLLQKSIQSVLSLFIGFHADHEHTKLLIQMLASTLESLAPVTDAAPTHSQEEEEEEEDRSRKAIESQQQQQQQRQEPMQFMARPSSTNSSPLPVAFASNHRANQYLHNDRNITTSATHNNNNNNNNNNNTNNKRLGFNLYDISNMSKTDGSNFSTSTSLLSSSSIISSIKHKAHILLKEFDPMASSEDNYENEEDGNNNKYYDNDDVDDSSSNRWRSELWDGYMEGKEFSYLTSDSITTTTTLPLPPSYLTADSSNKGGGPSSSSSFTLSSFPSSTSSTQLMMDELAGDPDGDILPTTSTSSATVWSPPIPQSHTSKASSSHSPAANLTQLGTNNSWKSFDIISETQPDYSTNTSKYSSSSPLFSYDNDNDHEIVSSISHSSPVDIFRSEDAARMSLDPLFATTTTTTPPTSSRRITASRKVEEINSDSKLLKQYRRDNAPATNDTPKTIASSTSTRKSISGSTVKKNILNNQSSEKHEDIIEKYKNQFRNDKLQRAEEAIALSLSFIETAEKLKKKKNSRSRISK